MPKALRTIKKKPRYNRSPSLMATSVAHEVVDKIGKGRKVSVSAIMKEKGYSESYAKQPQRITSQPIFNEVLQRVINRMEAIRDNALKEITSKKLSRANANDLTTVIDKMTKNIELLSGRVTERVDTLSDEEKSKMDALLKRNQKK